MFPLLPLHANDVISVDTTMQQQGGGCDPYFDVRLDGVRKIFDYKKAVKKVEC